MTEIPADNTATHSHSWTQMTSPPIRKPRVDCHHYILRLDSRRQRTKSRASEQWKTRLIDDVNEHSTKRSGWLIFVWVLWLVSRPLQLYLLGGIRSLSLYSWPPMIPRPASATGVLSYHRYMLFLHLFLGIRCDAKNTLTSHSLTPLVSFSVQMEGKYSPWPHSWYFLVPVSRFRSQKLVRYLRLKVLKGCAVYCFRVSGHKL